MVSFHFSEEVSEVKCEKRYLIFFNDYVLVIVLTVLLFVLTVTVIRKSYSPQK